MTWMYRSNQENPHPCLASHLISKAVQALTVSGLGDRTAHVNDKLLYGSVLNFGTQTISIKYQDFVFRDVDNSNDAANFNQLPYSNTKADF